MKFIITGGCGFIGSHLVDLLIKDNHTVLVIDNLYSGSKKNIEAHKNYSNLYFKNICITDIESLNKLFKGYDGIFHLAGLADIVPSIENPQQYYDVNVTGTLNVLQAALKNNIDKIVYAASSSCYGLPKIFPTSEIAPAVPEYPYALTKYLGEQLVLHWEKVYKIKAISLRLFNVYGLRSRTSGAYGAVFGVFLSQKVNNKPLTVVGDGSQTRDFTYVTDVANAFYLAMKSKISGQVYNVGSGGHYSINYLVSLLNSEKVNIPKRPGEPDCTFADITKIKKDLLWEPKVSFEDGVNTVIKNITYWKNTPLWDKDSIKKATKSWFEHLS